MKLKFTLLCPLVFMLLLSLNAEEAKSESSASEAEKELPEYSNPPYVVGDRAIIQGYYISLEEGISLNFRILDNRVFVYWVDADDLIVEPQAKNGNIRFTPTGRTRRLPLSLYEMEPLAGQDGLGTVSSTIFKPHLFNVVLSLGKADSEEFDTHAFRYVSAMNERRETRELIESEDGTLGNNGIIRY